MASNDRCVFCGKSVSPFRSTTVRCGNTYQLSCRDCEKELGQLDDLERCRRALLRGLAERPERLREQIELSAEAEAHRPTCGRCGGRLRFMKEQHFDNTPHGDSVFHDSFDVLPAWCTDCGRFEFFHPAVLRQNRFLAFLQKKDIAETDA